MSEKKKSTSTMTIVTIVFLILFFPIGLLLMWRKTHWPKPVKWLVSAYFALFLIGNAYAWTHPAALSQYQPSVTKAPTATLTLTNSPTPTLSYTPTPFPTRTYIPPTVIPTAVILTPNPTAASDTTQQTVQTNNGATALCNDGTYSYAANHQGACSHHQGVQVFYQ